MHAVLVCLLCASTTVLAAQEWWRTAVFYQIYPRSFKDSDNDGVGDINGITSKIDYLVELGVTAIWLSPIFKSPMADYGYDIANFTDCDPIFGDISGLKTLIATVKERGIKIILDFVPNHSSDEHPWFNMSVYQQGDYSDYYIWRNQSGTNASDPQVPNNWQSVFSGSAWEWSEVRQQYYLHQFVVKQPDLNYRNAKVVQEMENAMQFWLDLGVDGFRIDAAKFLIENDTFPDEPLLNASKSLYFDNLDHIYTQNQDITYEIIKGWSALINKMNQDGNSRVLLLEVYNTLPNIMKYYGGTDAPFTIPFNFHLLEGMSANMTGVDLLTNINEWLHEMPKNGTANWVVGNHDNSRVANRSSPELVDSINMLLAMLPGMMITYNGDELGMTNTYLRFEECVDPSGTLLGPDDYTLATRDPERTPLQWDDTVNAGFCTCANNKTWLPVNPNYWTLNVEAQRAAAKSHLHVYKNLTRLRQAATFTSDTTAYAITSPVRDTLIIERWSDEGETYVLIVNLASIQTTTVYSLTNVTLMMVNVASINANYTAGDIVVLSEGVTLRPKAAVIMQTFVEAPVSAGGTLALSLPLLLFTIYVMYLS